MSRVTEQLTRAREHLLSNEWGQGRYRAFTGHSERYCLVGAVAYGNGYNPSEVENGPTCEHLAVTLGWADIGSTIGEFLTAWNDVRERTKEQVLAALSHAIESAT